MMRDISNIFNVYKTKEEIPFYLLSKSVSFPTDNEDIYKYVYISENTPWTILSWQIYGTIDYWWVLCSLNKDAPFYAKKETNVKYIPYNTLEKILTYI